MEKYNTGTPNVDKMYTYLRGFLTGARMDEAVRALQYARDKHNSQIRKDGTPYIVHPLSMTCYAIALGLRNENVICTLLLHDICEDCNVEVDALPFNSAIKTGVRYMTVKKFATDKSKIETKRRYFKELLESREALLCKAFDRYNNLCDMPFALTKDAIGKNVAETEILLLPTLKEAKEQWAELSDILFVLRNNLRSVNNILKLHYREEYEKWYKEYTE